MQQTLRADESAFCVGHVWDRDRAHFRPCFLPVVATVPAILAALILSGQILRTLVSRRPRWMRAFVVEPQEPPLEVELVTRRRWSFFALSLGILSVLGFSLQLAASVQTPEIVIGYVPLIVWFVTVQQVLLYRPRTIPFAILAIDVFQLAAAASTIGNGTWRNDAVHVLSTCAVAVAGLMLIVLMFMPFRDPMMPKKDISKPFTDPSSALRSPEDDLSLWHFMTVSWVGPLLSTAKKRQLEDEDVWLLPYEFHHRRLHENFRLLRGTVIRRLVTANAIDLMILISLSFVTQLMDYASPFFLQLILSTMADPDVPTRVSMTYAGLTLVARLISAQWGVFNLWFGRRCYERSRGEMITMLYEKTLARKMSFLPDEKEGKAASNDAAATGNDTNGNSNGLANGEAGPKQSPAWWSRGLRAMNCFGRQKPPPPPKGPASMGKILNLMRNDVYEVAQRFWEFDAIVQKPLALIISVALVVNFLGWSSMIAVGVIIFAQISNALIARILVYYEKKRRVATDAKLQVITQFVEAIRHLRWYGWQGSWLTDIMSARQKELNLRVICTIWNVTIGFISILSLDLTPVVAFFAYTTIAGKHLTVDVAFPAMTLFQMMNQNLRDVPQLVLTLINAWVAVGRIEDFMAEPDRQEMATEALIGDKLAINGASFSWPGSTTLVLQDIELSFPEGMTVMYGEVGTGKTALLQAILGELDMARGQLLRPQEPIGYCAQTPWLQSMSIRENILFEEAYDDARYKKVLDACALTPDLAEFKAGDLSLIGENGIGLSGGQRARVALARAVYNKAKILLLDDPLSALDQQTAEAIVRNLFCGPLMADRTIVLVTHRVDLVYDIAAQMINLENGRAVIVDHEAAKSDVLRKTTSRDKDDTELDAALLATAVPDKFIEDEHRAHGGVQMSVYWEYLKAGGIGWWFLNIIIFALARGSSLLEAWLLKAWGEAYQTQSLWAPPSHYSHSLRAQGGIFDGLPPPDIDVKPWLWTFLGVALAQSFTFIVGQALMLVIVYKAGRNMFRDIMQKVTYATFRFYDVTPVGRLMNRMTSDIGVVDGGIGRQFQLIGWQGVAFISSVTVIASVTPAFLIFTILLTVSFVLIFLRFISASQSLRRLEMVSLTPLMSNFGSLLNGLTTVRAFRVQSRFQDRVIQVVDTFQKMDHFYWSAQAWLQYRYDILSASSTFLMFVLALATGLSPGLTAFVLLAAQRFVSATHSLCRQYGMLQMEFVSVERVVELLHLEQEPKGDVSPPAWWPLASGDIKFNDVTIKYAPHLDPALRGVSFTIKGGSKTAIIGRTGSGKSTLALSMLGTVLPDLGQISVDNVDLATVDKQLLRTRVTFLAQDPILFPGTMRQNLDPVDEHTDEECETVLQRVCERQGWTLDTEVEAGGKNLSQGQRQLVGLTRAVLRRSAIIILDEATASIDRETAMQIQQVMHEEMKDSTVITIAHRLEAVRNADYCIVLGKGRIIEQGPADEMLEKHRTDMLANVEGEDEGIEVDD